MNVTAPKSPDLRVLDGVGFLTFLGVTWFRGFPGLHRGLTLAGLGRWISRRHCTWEPRAFEASLTFVGLNRDIAITQLHSLHRYLKASMVGEGHVALIKQRPSIAAPSFLIFREPKHINTKRHPQRLRNYITYTKAIPLSMISFEDG